MRLRIRVRPGAGRTAVGGRYGDDETLVVAVRERAVDGAATDAAVRAVAAAFGLPRAQIRIVGGRTARTKVLEVVGRPDHIAQRLARLLEGPEWSR
ncbi:DUF167 domain-containing protein [Nostocoides sp. F2B08]|uniref:DUF167 domain-containing protein n=1 Tax=Nostocoides sp. F2B08 TaxID=2653936 RepID=UPI001262C1CE|nr:DUF167 domain-containing protein [Tetrasphaera sp. F2B08]KAB7742467.1 DUF167 domain-containing protein [Tetrasphaera sp. F2B08]